MARMRRDLLVAAALVLIGTCRPAHGQAPAQAGLGTPTLTPPSPVLTPDANPPATVWPPPEYRLPPLDETMTRPAPGDPMLDYPVLPPPGWFANVELGALAPHFKNRMVGEITLGGATTTLHVPGAALDWAAAPRFEFGYRLPRGFGEFRASYQGLSTQGQGDLFSDSGMAHLNSRLTQNILLVDYGNARLLPAIGVLGDGWLIGGRAGVQVQGIYYDARANQLSLDGTLTGQQVTNNVVGAGPHAQLELLRRLPLPGLTFHGWIEGATLYSHIEQSFTETILAPGADAVGTTHRVIGSQNIGFLGGRLGFDWTPPANNHLRLFLGYQFYQWWQLGRTTTIGSTGSLIESQGTLTEHGIIVRGEFTF
jgi:hypothetical protein